MKGSRVSGLWFRILFAALCFFLVSQFSSQQALAAGVVMKDLQLSSKAVKVGDYVDISLDLGFEPAAVASSVYLTLRAVDDGNTYSRAARLEYDEAAKKYVTKFKIEDYHAKGNWKVSEISVFLNGRDYFFKNAELFPGAPEATDLSAGNFYVDPSGYQPQLGAVSIDKNQGSLGDTIKISAAGLNNLGNYDSTRIEAVYRTPSDKLRSFFFSDSFNPQISTISIDQSFETGTWKLDHFVVTDRYNYNYRYVYNSVFYSGENTRDFSNIDFTVGKASGWVEVNGKRYFIDESGNPKVGWFDYDHHRYYFDENGVMVTGWIYVDDKEYYLNKDGKMVAGWNYIEDGMYYFLTTGELVYDWQLIDNKWYFFDEYGTMVTGFAMIGSEFYYFNSDGVMQTGWQQIEGDWYYFNNEGELVTGWVSWNKKWYYLDEQEGYMVTGAHFVGGKLYIFDSNGAMAAGGWKNISGKWYYLNTSGAAAVDWKQVNGKWYYFDPNNGVMATGWKNLYVNQALYSAPSSIKEWYYFGTSGAMTTGWLYQGGKWYYLNKWGGMATGMQIISGTKYYFKTNGAMAANEWVNLGPNNKYWYYYLSSGKQAVGWHTINGKRYYFDKNGVLQ
ncbi:hypothetical protein [Neobacillus bataviensis]|uniref:hypothetical protein n=1 Tax=Neobacillus bataviensis TaxID=220685 RepID=UPI001CBE4D02|nr:hypothetical protein [Neobacillus bataviensis]